jgi:hypothetical protein
MESKYSGPRDYKSVTISYRGQVINQLLNDLHSQQEQMIEQALEYSDLQQARDVIDWIKNKR